jgi:hypothetical protein
MAPRTNTWGLQRLNRPGNGDPVLHVQRRRDRAGLGPRAEGQAELACAIERK